VLPSPRTGPLRKALALAAIAIAGVAFVMWREPADEALSVGVSATGSPLPSDLADDPEPSPKVVTITVHVKGNVAHPGLVVLRDGARVADAIAASGGLLPGANADGVNLAERLADGQVVSLDAAVGGGAQPAPTSSVPAKVDLNSATVDELDALPGVGPVLAQRIVAYREEHGRFDSVDQLGEVSGIGEGRLNDLTDLVRVGSR